MTNNHIRHSHPGKRRTCKVCKAEYMRNYRQVVGLTPEGRRKMNARGYAAQYLRRGKIERRPCFFCNSMKNLQFHHEDYERPLMTISVCRPHHVMLTHNKLCLIPSAVKAFWDFERASRAVNNAIAIDRSIRRIKMACSEIKYQAAQA